MKQHLEINFSDDRGSIRDIFVASPKDHCSIITFTKNAVRANHYHKESTQYTYVIEGEVLIATQVVDKKGSPIGDVMREVMGPGDLVTHLPYHAHAFHALKPTTILAFADGIRGGREYEQDVFRLKTSII